LLKQRGFHRRSNQRLQIASADIRVGVLAGDNLALLGNSDLACHAAGGLRQNRLIARAAATANRAATAVEQSHFDTVLLQHLDQLDFGFVQFPVRSQVTAILVAVRIAEHDFLHIAAGFE